MPTTLEPSAQTSDVYVMLLRGINVGGNNKLAMRDLSDLLKGLGCSDIKTYIQSGNAVLRAPPSVVTQLAYAVRTCIAMKLGLTVPVVLRSASELRDIFTNNPFALAAHDPDHLHVAFLADHPTPEHLLTLDPARSPPDEFIVRGQDLYLLLPNGVAKTKLSNAWLDSKLKTTSTVRNWRTVEQLVKMTEGLQ